jgi:hypothetical protein
MDECHPGLYFSSKEWLIQEYGENKELVETAAYVCCVMAIGQKFRTKELWVL